jgi:translation initiation factor 3 subunit L
MAVGRYRWIRQALCIWRSKITTKTQGELTMLVEGGPVRMGFCCFYRPLTISKVWSSYSVLNVLYSLMQKINGQYDYIAAQREGKSW